MKLLAASLMSLAMLASAAPALAQPGREHGRGGGPPPAYEHRGGEQRWNGGWGPNRGGYSYPRGAYAGPRGAYAAPPPAYQDYRGGYPAARGGYGYAGPAPARGPDAYGGNWGRQQDEVRAGVRQGRYVGLARVIGSIRQRSPGHQLDAGLEQWGGRAVYRVRWAEPDGRRVDYIVDAQSGAIVHVDDR